MSILVEDIRPLIRVKQNMAVLRNIRSERNDYARQSLAARSGFHNVVRQELRRAERLGRLDNPKAVY